MSGRKMIGLVVNAMGYHSRSFCDGCAEAAHERGWDVRLILTSGLHSPSALSSCDGVIARGLSEHCYDVLRRSGKTVVETAVKGTGDLLSDRSRLADGRPDVHRR